VSFQREKDAVDRPEHVVAIEGVIGIHAFLDMALLAVPKLGRPVVEIETTVVGEGLRRWRPGSFCNGEGNAEGKIAVGTPVARRPPHRSQRALLTHWAPALGKNAKPLEPLEGRRVTDPGQREIASDQPFHAGPKSAVHSGCVAQGLASREGRPLAETLRSPVRSSPRRNTARAHEPRRLDKRPALGWGGACAGATPI
jgi:hypothetical protein